MADDTDEGWIHWGGRMLLDGALVVGAVLAAPVVLPWIGTQIGALATALAPDAAAIAANGGTMTTMQTIASGASSALTSVGTGIGWAGTEVAYGLSSVVAGVSTSAATNPAFALNAFKDGTAQSALWSVAKDGVVSGVSSAASYVKKNPIPFAAGAGGLIIGRMLSSNDRAPAPQSFASAEMARRQASAGYAPSSLG